MAKTASPAKYFLLKIVQQLLGLEREYAIPKQLRTRSMSQQDSTSLPSPSLTVRSDVELLSTKYYSHSVGLSCVFRQFRATDSHCRFLHGYSIGVRLTFGCKHIDHRNWVQDFGGLKYIKKWLEDTFDHKVLVAKNDPFRGELIQLERFGLIQITHVEAVGCEAFAHMIFDYIDKPQRDNRVYIQEVEVSEHEGNSAICRRKEHWRLSASTVGYGGAGGGGIGTEAKFQP